MLRWRGRCWRTAGGSPATTRFNKGESVNIFNLSELDDLPEDLVKELTVSTKDKFSTRILELFTLKNPLNVDEVTVAYYRRYSESKSRGAIHVKLYNMSRSEKYNIEAIKGRKGVYKLTAKPTITEGMRV